MQRDSLASHVGHYDRLSYMAMAQNESIARLRYQFLTVRSSLTHLENDPAVWTPAKTRRCFLIKFVD